MRPGVIRCSLTAVDPATGARADLLVTASEHLPAAPLLAQLRQAVSAGPDAPLTVGDRRLAEDGHVADLRLLPGALVAIGSTISSRRGAAVVELVVGSGPDAGRRFALSAGRYVVGRDLACDVTIDDPMMSRRHLVLEVDRDGATRLSDLESTNGIQPATGDGSAQVRSLRLGDSVVTIHRQLPPDPDAIADRVINHRAAVDPPVPALAVTFPSPPAVSAAPRLALANALVPLVVGLALSLLLHQWQFLLFTALSPLMVLGQLVSDRRATSRENRIARETYDAAVALATRDLDAALVTEAARRHAVAPDLGRITASTEAAADVIWQRGLDINTPLRLRLGLADQRSDVAVHGGEPALAHDVPLVVALPAAGNLGLAGPRRLILGLARSLVVQAASFHDPAALRIVVLARGGASTWGWLRWLPHLTAPDNACVVRAGFDADQITTRIAELRRETVTSPAPRTLVVIDDPGSAQYDDLPSAVAAIWCGSSESVLPSRCDAIATLTGVDRPRVELRNSSCPAITGIPDLLASDVATAAARRLAPLRSQRRGVAAIPTAVRWADLGLADVDGPVLAGGWAGDPNTVVPIGATETGIQLLDLVRDGPHALIAGTTGAGKSELLIHLVAGLAACNRPDQLSFLLIDHKGGAALGACRDLPHTVGIVTDLDPASTRRAMQSIDAELRRREAQLAAADVPDFVAYQRAHATPAMARLVIVVDEFAALVNGDREAADALVAIAQRGRSLGLHLILATQRPEGVVSADIRANTRIRICLGVTRDQESRDVIDSPIATTIARTTPGRAYLRIGPGELHGFQAAMVTGRSDPATVVVQRAPDELLGDPLPRSPGQSRAEMDLDKLIAVTRARSAELGCESPRPPWLPPLPDHLDAVGATWALVDLPAEGRQIELRTNPGSSGATVIVGTGGSGRSTAALAIAMARATTESPDDLHLWAIDGASGLQPLSRLPHCGAVIEARDEERVRELIDHLLEQVAKRRAGTTQGHQRSLLVVVDSWDALSEPAAERLLRLASDSGSVGLELVVTGSRRLLVGRLASLASERIVLRLTDPADYLITGRSRRELPSDLPPGRGFRGSDGALLQIAVRSTALRAGPAPRRLDPPRSFLPLPDRVPLVGLIHDSAGAQGHVVLGLDGENHAPATLTRDALGPAFLVAGQRRSGRSTALQVLAEQLSDRDLIVIADPRSSLAAARSTIVLPHHDPEHAAEILSAISSSRRPTPDLLVDDLDLIEDSRLTDAIDRHLRQVRDDGAFVAVSATIELAATAFRGPLATVRRAGQGVLLGARSIRDADILGLDLRGKLPANDPPGRGWLNADGRTCRIQIALPAAD